MPVSSSMPSCTKTAGDSDVQYQHEKSGQSGLYLCNRNSPTVDEETSVVEVATSGIVWHWLRKVLTAVALQEHTGRVCVVGCVLLDCGQALFVTC